jgi:phosphonate transport system substrate-binding protein
MGRLACHFVLLLTLGFAAWRAEAAPAEPPPLVLAVHPYLPSNEIQQRFAPLADYLGTLMERRIVVRTGRDYEEHVSAIGSNSVDIAFMGPSSYVLMVARYGSKPLLARFEVAGQPFLSGVIIVRADSPLRTLTDLKARRFAFGDRDSTMSSLVPQYMLQEAGVSLAALGAYDYLGGHKNVALGVLSGDYDAGAVKREVFDELASRGLRVLANMPTVSEHLFVTRSDLPPAQVEVLRRGLLALKSRPEGLAIMREIHKGITGMVPVVDADYQSLRAMMRALGIISR